MSTYKPFARPSSCLDCPYNNTACPSSCIFDVFEDTNKVAKGRFTDWKVNDHAGERFLVKMVADKEH